MPFLGEFIGLTTVLCWTISVQFFGVASKEVGATPVNIIRLSLAVLFFSLLLLIRDGSPIPGDFPFHAWLYLGLSGVIGFFIGDIFLFKALVELGPRLAMLMHSLAAPTSAVIGWLLLGETYVPVQWLGILVTLFGVSIVIFERSPDKKGPQAVSRKPSASVKGILFGIGAMLGQAGGFVLSKVGMQVSSGYLDAFSATQVRALAALFCFVIYFTLSGRWRNVKVALTNRRALLYTSIGSFLGPFIGVSLSLLTLHYLTAGVAATILSLVPVCIIPFSVFIHKEYVSFKAVAGAFVAVFGIYLLVS